MWLATVDGFLSAVEYQNARDPELNGKLAVRARERSALVNFFKLTPRQAKEQIRETNTPTTKSTDYSFRVYVTRERFAEATLAAVNGIDYPNFKSEVLVRAKAGRVSWTYEKALHSVWGIFGRIQKGGPYGWYSRPPKKSKPKPRNRRASRAQQSIVVPDTTLDLSLDDEFRAWVEGDVGIDPDSLTLREQVELTTEWAGRSDADPSDPRFVEEAGR